MPVLQLYKNTYYSYLKLLTQAGTIAALLTSLPLKAQEFKGRSFEFLNLPGTARLTGLGGINVSSADKDPNMFLSNPSSLANELDKFISFNYTPYFAGINYLSTTFSKNTKSYGNWGVGINYLSYGSFEGYDAAGEPTEEFRANEYAIVIGNAHHQNNFSFGANAKLVGSNIAGYSSSAVLFDLGGMFIHPSQDLKVGMTIKNIGFRLKKYNTTSEFALPFDVQLGGSFKPKHMPLRFSITLHRLYKFDTQTEAGSAVDKVKFTDQLFRHFVFGTEIIISKNINLRAGYNYLRRKELKLDQKGGAAGFSFGAMIRVKAFEIAYSRAIFSKAGANNCFTIITNLAYFTKK